MTNAGAPGDVDRAHADGVWSAHHYFAEDRDYIARAGYAAYRADELYETTAATGTYLRAFLSTTRTLDIERDDRRAAFSAVAAEWWANPARAAWSTPYGAPWSPAYGPRIDAPAPVAVV